MSNSQIRTCSIFNMRAISYLAMLAFQLYQLLVFSIILQPHTPVRGKISNNLNVFPGSNAALADLESVSPVVVGCAVQHLNVLF